MPKISIILPTFNVEKYIAKALESCINQSFKDIEIIVVDDCGSDKSIDIAKEYAKKDERIKIIHNEENLGLLRARYEGVKAAGGGYIMFLDPDKRFFLYRLYTLPFPSAPCRQRASYPIWMRNAPASSFHFHRKSPDPPAFQPQFSPIPIHTFWPYSDSSSPSAPS